MNAFLRRLAAAFSLVSLALSWPLAFVSAQTAPAAEPTPIAIIGDSQNEGFVGYNALPPLLTGYRVVGGQCNRSWTVAQLHNGGGASGSSASCFRNQSSISFLNGLSPKPKAIIVFAGGGGTDTAAGLQAFVADLKEIAPVVIWVGPFHSKTASVMARHTANSQTQKNTLPGLGVNWIEAIAINPSFTYSDGTHFTAPEYREISTQLAPQILQYLAAASSANPATAPEASTDPVIPVTDALGRSQAEIQQAVAAQCADSNPVFPVRLGVGIGGTTEVNGLTEYINVVYRYMTAIVLVVAIVMVTYGGFRYLLAASPIGVKDGKDIIKNAIVGMVLVLSAYVILNTINPATTVLQFTRPPEDIVCHGYQVSIGNFSGGNDQCSEETQERDCGVGKRCVMTKIVLQNVTEAETFGILAAGVAGGAYVGGPLGASIGGVGSIGTMFYQAGDGVHKCTDGNTGSPCAGDEDCNDGTVCAADWQICLPATGNPRSGPCDPARSNMCASGSTCTATTDAWFENWGICRGQAPLLSWEAIRANNFVAPESSRCSDVQDCARTGSEIRCVGPAGTGKKYCIEAGRSVEGTFSDSGVDAGEGNPTPCYIIDGTVNGITPSTCQGTPGSQHACIICGNNNKWQALNLTSDPNMVRIGQCANRAKIGQVCRRR